MEGTDQFVATTYWMGKPLRDMDKEQLLEVIHYLHLQSLATSKTLRTIIDLNALKRV